MKFIFRRDDINLWNIFRYTIFRIVLTFLENNDYERMVREDDFGLLENYWFGYLSDWGFVSILMFCH